MRSNHPHPQGGPLDCPLFDVAPDEPALIDASLFFGRRHRGRLTGAERETPHRVIGGFNRFTAELARQRFDVVDEIEGPIDHGPLLILTSNGQRFGYADLRIGAAYTSMVLEQLIAAGVKELMTIGSCGGLGRHAQPGDVILPDRALRAEGVSPAYLGPGRWSRPDPHLFARLRRELKGCLVAGTWTTDAPFRETARHVEMYREEGVAAVDMELAALWAVARYRRVAAAGVLVLADRLGGITYDAGGLQPGQARELFTASLESAFAATADALLATAH